MTSSAGGKKTLAKIFRRGRLQKSLKSPSIGISPRRLAVVGSSGATDAWPFPLLVVCGVNRFAAGVAA
jgi:hypothetical protein